MLQSMDHKESDMAEQLNRTELHSFFHLYHQNCSIILSVLLVALNQVMVR